MAATMIGSTKTYPQGRPLRLRRHAKILATGAGMPDEVVTNQDIIDEADLIATDRAVQFSIGIRERRRAAHAAPPSQYLCAAAAQCIERSGIAAERIDRVIYCRLFGEHAVPATAIRVLERLGVRTGVPVVDVAAACSGFLHAMELAVMSINAGDDHVLVLGGDRAAVGKESGVKKDTRTIFLNGDGFAAMLLGKSEEPHFRCSYFYTDSDLSDFAYIPFGTELLDGTEAFDPGMFALTMPDGSNIHKSVLDSCRLVSSRLLELAGLTMKDIDFFITSDQTHLVWRDQVKLLELSETQSISCFPKYGNTVAAMAPLNLNEAIECGALRRGMTVMMMAHGAGASGGGFIFTY